MAAKLHWPETRRHP